MKEIKVFLVGNKISYLHFINFKYKQVKEAKDANLILFTGGEDVNPTLYNQKKHPKTQINLQRDLHEVFLFDSLPKDVLKVGICRGAQLLTVLAGGQLIQHVEGHNFNRHSIIFADGSEYFIPGDHHQMMYPENVEHELIAYSDNIATRYETVDKKGKPLAVKPKNFKEPEIVYYPGINALAIQGHPEWAVNKDPIVTKVNDLIKNYLYDLPSE